MNASTPGGPRKPADTDHVASAPIAEYHASMDKRVSILEMRFDTILPTLATKADIAELRTEVLTAQERLRSDVVAAIEKLSGDVGASIEKLRGDVGVSNSGLRVDMATLSDKLHQDMDRLHRNLIMWIVSTMIAMFLGMVGLFVSISSNMLQTTDRMIQAQVRAIEQAHAAPSP